MSEKINVKFLKNCDYTGEISENFHVLDVILLNLTFTFPGFHKKFFLVLLQMIYHIFSPWKM